MRLYFQQQLELGITPIHEIALNLKSRHSLAPLLRGLQHAYETPEMNRKIFAILDKKILGDKQKTGRLGMSLWEIFVLGTVRMNLNIDYDELHDLANEHHTIRGILGVQRSDFRSGKAYGLQTLKDNVRLLDEATIRELVMVIAEGTHEIIKKKEDTASLSLRVKADSFVVESAIHFPTDLNLLWDSVRKSVETIGYFCRQKVGIAGWREWKDWRRKVRTSYRIASEIHRKKGANYEVRLQEAVENYLAICEEVAEKVARTMLELTVKERVTGMLSPTQVSKLAELRYYEEMLKKHIDLVYRRIILGEVIPHSEKVFSIHQPHVEWNSKGKANKKVELGHNVLMTTDQYGLILYWEVYEQQVDKQRSVDVGNILAQQYGGKYDLRSISFDKNFFSLPAQQSLSNQFELVILPKAGKASRLELAQSENEDYQRVKKSHSLVEGNISELESHGLDICPDKGIAGFKRYVAYGVLSYNLTKLGRMLMAAEIKEMKRLKKRKMKPAA